MGASPHGISPIHFGSKQVYKRSGNRAKAMPVQAAKTCDTGEVMKKRLLVSAMAVGMAGGTALPATAAPWTRGFVVGTYEYAFRYGGRPDYSRGAEIEPGVDCPHGSSTHFANDTRTKAAVARQKWRSQQEINSIAKPPGLDQVRAPVETRFWIWDRAVSYRGYRRGIETYINPFATDDPGEPEVTSRIGDGFNLDGKVGPNDFVSPDGERGSTTPCIAPGAAMRPGAAITMQHWTCAPTTRCRTACTPW